MPTPREIERIYERHPLRRTTLLARVARQRRSLDGLTERDLAIDRRTQITDQNNVGGASNVLRLARLTATSTHSRILDLGCGIGGPARLFAHVYGCHVDGIDISRSRVRDARVLTRLVSLSHLVTIHRGDITSIPVPAKRYNVICGLSAWMHIEDIGGLVERWRPALKRGGYLAIQDVCLVRRPTNETERGLVNRLQHDWAGRLLEAREWAALVSRAGFHLTLLRRSSRAVSTHFSRLAAATSRASCPIPLRETRSWRDAVTAADRRLIASFTLIARR